MALKIVFESNALIEVSQFCDIIYSRGLIGRFCDCYFFIYRKKFATFYSRVQRLKFPIGHLAIFSTA